MTQRDFPPSPPTTRLVTLIAALFLILPVPAIASAPGRHTVGANSRVTVVFGQEMGNIRPFSVTIAPNGSVGSTGPIRLTGTGPKISRDVVFGLVVLAQAEGFRTLPSFTACQGALPDLATRYVIIKSPGWQHRAGVRGGCLHGMNELFAVLMSVAHASF